MRNVPASVLAKLKNRARQEGNDLQQLITRYGLERMLYRLSQSGHGRSFLLKGAMLFNLWFDMPHRPTTDVDMLAYGDHGLDTLAGIFRQVCGIPCDDGIAFDAATVKAEQIRKESNYEGVRVTFLGHINRVRCPIQVDIGYGDAVTPHALDVDYPVLLDDMPKPALRAYPTYTVVAEKTEAMTKLAMANTRLKDYFDLWILSQHSDFEGDVLRQAIAATFERRKTRCDPAPIGLSDEFADDDNKSRQWLAFLKKNRLQAPALPDVVRILRTFLSPVLESIAGSSAFTPNWSNGAWEETQAS